MFPRPDTLQGGASNKSNNNLNLPINKTTFNKTIRNAINLVFHLKNNSIMRKTSEHFPVENGRCLRERSCKLQHQPSAYFFISFLNWHNFPSSPLSGRDKVEVKAKWSGGNSRWQDSVLERITERLNTLCNGFFHSIFKVFLIQMKPKQNPGTN